jgi:glycosyltransferase involved in cell wall biosynthesis
LDRADQIVRLQRIATHPAVLAALTREELKVRIDQGEFDWRLPQDLGRCQGYRLVRQGDHVYAIPESAGTIDPDLLEEHYRVSVHSGRTVEEVRALVERHRGNVPVEFAGWLPIYEWSGNCGSHPQFKHVAEPPSGYRFTCSAPPSPELRPATWNLSIDRLMTWVWGAIRPLFAFFWVNSRVGIQARWRILASLVRLFVELIGRGCELFAVLRFLQSRHLQSQLLLGDQRSLVFLTSMPYTYNQWPWVVEIEDPLTLFYPLIRNGEAHTLDIKASPYLPVVRALLESDQCKAILTHMRSTAELLPALFDSEVVRRKVIYTPLGVKLPARWQRHDEAGNDAPINLLFINSWCQQASNFCVRGGLDVLEAFGILRERYPQLRLTMRTALPQLAGHYHRVIEQGWVRVVNRFLSAEEMAELHAESHIFLLPAARVHIVSLLQAMSYGLAVVASDGWGFEEYLRHEENGLIVRGRYGKTSWADREAGIVRENYEPTYSPSPEIVQGLVEAVSRLIEDRALRARLGRAARADVESQYSLEQWNRGLKAAFDRAGLAGIVPTDPTTSRRGPNRESLLDRIDITAP